MLTDRFGKELWIQDELGEFTPVKSHKDIQGRPRSQDRPDWWVVAKDKDWTPPEPTSLLNLGSAAGSSGAGGSGGSTKIGSGHKPQPYGWHGYYGETGGGGGSSSGPVYRGKVSPPNEAHGKVTPPAPTAPAGVTWKNDTPNRPPTHEGLEQRTREAVEDMNGNVRSIEPFNVNSGKRDGTGPHAEGRAVDIDTINGKGIRAVVERGDPQEMERLRQQSADIEAWARNNNNVEMVITPYGGFFRNPDGTLRKASDAEIKAHWNHFHIQTRK
jgi:hypothetical protein